MPRAQRHKRTDRASLPDEPKLWERAQRGERAAYRELFVRSLPALERFVTREIHYFERTGVLEQGLIDPRAVIDQAYIAGLANVKHAPANLSLRGWLRYLALHILRQQARIEHEQEPRGPALELAIGADVDIDTDLWEFYQPDDVVQVEDVLTDRSAADPEESIELRELTDELEQAINKLPGALREALVLRVIEELSLDEIAALTQREPEEIRQSVHDARQLLRETMTPSA